MSVALTINADSGTGQYNGKKAMFRIRRTNGTGSQSLTLTAQSSGVQGFRQLVAAPTSIPTPYIVYIGCVWNPADNCWDVIAVRESAV